jgi:hypothetical protein
MDFTLNTYIQILKAITESGFRVYSVSAWVNKNPDTGVLIRHDVDRMPLNALKMAKAEADLGLQTTYYFRSIKSVFKPDIIKNIADLGHEIGYHYEDLSLASGDILKAKVLFETHLQNLRSISPVCSVAMHGRPLSGIDNRVFWISYKLSDFNLDSEAFLTIDYTDVYYFTDTGRSWSENSMNLRDNVSTHVSYRVNKSTDLINFIQQSDANKKICIVAHPERWNNQVFKWISYAIFDYLALIIKMILKRVRK